MNANSYDIKSHKDTDSVVFYYYLVACIQHTILAHTCILDDSDQHNIRDYSFLLGVEDYQGLYTLCILPDLHNILMLPDDK